MADTAHSPKYATVKKYYDAGLWLVNRVYNAVGRWITADEYMEITGIPYAAAEE